jgi:hypothetical protein
MVATYRGPVPALTEAGAVTAELLAPVPRGQRRLDQFGHHIGLPRRARWIEVTRWVPLNAALQSPGMTAWMVDTTWQQDEFHAPTAAEALARVQWDTRRACHAATAAADALGTGIGTRRLRPDDVRVLKQLAANFAAQVEAAVVRARRLPGQDMHLV